MVLRQPELLGGVVVALVKTRLQLAILIACALYLAGCGINDQFDNQVERLDRSVEAARNTLIVTNIVRASRQIPLSFISVPMVHASNTTTSNFGLPAFTFGPHQTVAEHLFVFGGGSGSGSQNSIGYNGTTSFDVSVIADKDFYKGILNPVPPETVRFFTAQGISREVVFYLFVGRVTTFQGGTKHTFINDPTDPTFAGFQEYLRLALDYGFVSEQLDETTDKTKAATGEAKPQERRSHVCFEPRLARKPLKGVHPVCGSKEKTALGRDEASYTGASGLVRFEVSPRSPLEVFQYLGRLVAEGKDGYITLQEPYPVGPGAPLDPILFRIERGPLQEGCFVDVNYNGFHYCVPGSSAPNTTRIVALLGQLVALATTLNDLSLTQNVRVTN